MPTHRRGAALDLVFASPGPVQSVEVHDGATCHCVDRRICCPQVGSDHFALTVTLRFNVVSAVPSPNTTLQVRSWPTLLQSQFHEVQRWVQQVNEVNSIAHSLTKADARQQLDMLYSSFLDIIWKGDESLYKHRTDQPTRQQPDWWNDVCMDMLLARNSAWRERRRNPTPDTAAAFRRARNKFHRVVQLAKHNYWSSWLDYIDKCHSVCPRSAARAVRRRFRRNKARIAPRLCPNPTAPQNEQNACLAAWRSHFVRAGSQGVDTFNPRHFARIRRRIRRIREQHSVHINSGQPFTLLELEQALHHCSTSKAPGVDNIPYEALCVDLSWWRHAIRQFLDLCRSLCCIPSVWKHGIVVPLPKATASADRDGYRLITLTCCFAKILERLILNRIKPDVDPMFDESQAGFRFGSDVQVYGLLETLHIRRNATTFCAFLDIRKAFDVAWKDGALLRLHRAGVQDGLWHLIDDLISDRTASARIQSTMSDDWDVEHGIGQGAVLSGFLFNILINGLAAAIKRACHGATCTADNDSNNFTVQVLLYADDIVILSSCPHDLQRALDAADAWAKS